MELLPLQEELTESRALRASIGAEIERDGPITFRRYMERVLYDPEEGYYPTRHGIGARGDFLTSPELHPLFGAVVARQVAEFWDLLGRPRTLRLVEVGPGNGTLARGMLATLAASGLSEALQPVLVEPATEERAAQAATLGSLARGVTWVSDLEALRPDGETPTVLLSNELLDSFPVHRVTVKDGRPLEIYVAWDGDCFHDEVGPLSTPFLGDYFDRLGLLPGEGCVAEVNLAATAWMAQVAQLIGRGFVLTLDYGYEAPQLYAPWRLDGTLLCFYQHSASTDPYRRLGRQDLTAHVDFTSLMHAGLESGLEPLGLISQRLFLARLGIGDVLAGGPASASSLEEYLSRRRAVDALLDSQGLGRIRVLAQGKAVGRACLHAFRDPAEAVEDG